MATSVSVDSAITTLNARRKATHTGLQVERWGDRLSLRGTLPHRG